MFDSEDDGTALKSEVQLFNITVPPGAAGGMAGRIERCKNRLRKNSRIILAGVALVACALLAAWWYRQLPESQYRAAEKAMSANQLSVVRKSLDALRNEPGYQAHAHLLRGFLILRSHPRDERELEEASKDFPFAFDHPATRVMARVLAGECYYRRKRYGDAAVVLRQAVVIDPENVAAFRWLSSVLFDVGAFNFARSSLLRVVELAPEDGKPHWFLGQIALVQSGYSDAIKEFQLALEGELSPNLREDVHLGLAISQIQTRQYAEALVNLSHCRKSSARLKSEAECHYATGEKGKAQVALDEALRISPNDLGALSLQGKIFLESGDSEGAVKVLSRAEANNFDDHLIHYKLAAAYRLVGDMEGFERQNKLSVEVQRMKTRFTELVGQAATNPDDVEVRYQLGVVSRDLRQINEARRWFTIALGIDPTFEKARIALDELNAAEQAAGASRQTEER